MLYVKIYGGIGNQLFQYACAYELARKENQKLYICPDFSRKIHREYKLNCFAVKYDCELTKNKIPFLYKVLDQIMIRKIIQKLGISKIETKNYIYLLQNGAGDRLLIPDIKNKNIFLSGYWFHVLISDQYEKELLDMLYPVFEESRQFYELSAKMGNGDVAVHVRRGDYLKVCPESVLKKDYYETAIEYLIENEQVHNIYFFSDDIEWVQKEFSYIKNTYFIHLNNENADIEEMCLMSLCQYNVISDSTFSVWAARMNKNNNKLVVMPDSKGKYGNIDKNWIKVKNAHALDKGQPKITKV